MPEQSNQPHPGRPIMALVVLTGGFALAVLWVVGLLVIAARAVLALV